MTIVWCYLGYRLLKKNIKTEVLSTKFSPAIVDYARITRTAA